MKNRIPNVCSKNKRRIFTYEELRFSKCSIDIMLYIQNKTLNVAWRRYPEIIELNIFSLSNNYEVEIEEI